MMDISGNPLPKDRAEAARRTRAKIIDEERKKRIFNPVVRIIGIDKDAIDRQVQEKITKREQEQVKNKAYSNKLLQDCATSLKLEELNKQRRKQFDLEILEYRKHYQAPETRREHDINDPLACKRGQPNRVDDDDPRVTLSSCQRFEGEADTTGEQRTEQMQQQRVWLEMQIRERKMDREEDTKVERNRREIERATIERSLALASLEDECRQKLVEANYRYNRALATEQRMNRNIAEAENREDNMAEVHNAITGNFLTENPEIGFQNALRPGKISTSLYKGLTPAMQRELYEEQAKQRVELEKRKEASEKQEKDWAELFNMLVTCGMFRDREILNKKRSLEDEVKKFNFGLADEQKKEQEFLNNVLYKTTVSDEFYEQFNKTTR